jgi:hypothetical protein
MAMIAVYGLRLQNARGNACLKWLGDLVEWRL